MKKAVLIVLLLVVIGVAYWLIAPVFIDTRVSEPVPGTVSNESMNDTTAPESRTISPEEETEAGLDAEPEAEQETEPQTQPERDDENEESMETEEEAQTTTGSTVRASGTFVGLDGHEGQGTVRLLDVDGTSYVRMEDDFFVTNGPDVFVYLGSNGTYDPEARLGKLKGNVGSQNYEIPDSVDLNEYNEVWAWCRAFSVAMGKAELSY